MHLSSIEPRSVAWVLGCCTLLLYFFYSLQKVSGQQILEACLKEFWTDFIFTLRLVVHIHALRKIRFGGSKAMDPILFTIISFLFFQEREIYFFSKGFYCCSPNFYLFRKLKQGQDKTAWTPRGILTKYSQGTLKGDLCLLCILCILLKCVLGLGYLQNESSFRTYPSIWSLACRG